jgi:hypothetical protein
MLRYYGLKFDSCLPWRWNLSVHSKLWYRSPPTWLHSGTAQKTLIMFQFHNSVACRLKTWIAESARTSIARQQPAVKLTHISAATNKCGIAIARQWADNTHPRQRTDLGSDELFEAVINVRFTSRLQQRSYNQLLFSWRHTARVQKSSWQDVRKSPVQFKCSRQDSCLCCKVIKWIIVVTTGKVH